MSRCVHHCQYIHHGGFEENNNTKTRGVRKKENKVKSTNKILYTQDKQNDNALQVRSNTCKNFVRKQNWPPQTNFTVNNN